MVMHTATPRKILSKPLARAFRLSREEGGAGAVEFALILPALAMMVLGIVEFGRTLWTQNALHYSVEQAARCASIDKNNCATSSQIASYAAGLSGAPFASTVFTASVASCGNQVSASLPVQLNIPFLDYSLTLTAQSCYPIYS
jgi:Flp pilus assembly protein TadG